MGSLRITLGTGETHEVAFTPQSTLTVINPVENTLENVHHSWSDVVEVDWSDADLVTPAQPVVGADVDQDGNTIPPTVTTTGEHGEERDVTEAAWKLAEEHGVDLVDVPGTGANGTVTKGDVQAHIDKAEGS
jgi:pyruvate/2-oxoglutarate dehydrogenase complex dihydrolipoamide acyltransferase (E2) component